MKLNIEYVSYYIKMLYVLLASITVKTGSGKSHPWRLHWRWGGDSVRNRVSVSKSLSTDYSLGKNQ